LNLTSELSLKFEPLTVKVKAAAPTALLVGEILLNVGTGLLTVKVAAVTLVPPPGVGLKTVIEGVPAVRRSDAGITAVNWVALTNVVERGLPFR
jgi:hypothetical protein